jgi:hypothetical protein
VKEAGRAQLVPGNERTKITLRMFSRHAILVSAGLCRECTRISADTESRNLERLIIERVRVVTDGARLRCAPSAVSTARSAVSGAAARESGLGAVTSATYPPGTVSSRASALLPRSLAASKISAAITPDSTVKRSRCGSAPSVSILSFLGSGSA